ncbi:hypothetical protein [Moorena sp. SIO3B2]|uniref:hypothetical protein n=1 Tax=Moorena sp. SIO3B2 TaxID=2607827 RepID=UPI00257DDCA8|nr:hypothetical protein [Moorena sp. SIO3B2]
MVHSSFILQRKTCSRHKGTRESTSMGQIAILEAFSDLPDARLGQRMLTRAWLYVWLSLP